MPPSAGEDRSSPNNQQGHQPGHDHENGIWRGLKALIFGAPHDDTLRGQLEEAIDRHEGDPAATSTR